MQGVSVLIVVLLGLGNSAFAQEAPEQASPTPSEAAPGEAGATLDMRDQAREIASEGLKLKEVYDYPRALEAFEQSLELWDDPNVHHQVAVSLQALGRTVEAHEAMEKALAPSATPLENPDAARDYRRFLRSQLSRLVISSEEVGAIIFVDGTALFDRPQRKELLLRPGTHIILAKKPGMKVYSKEIDAVGGTDMEEVAISMVPMPVNFEMKRRWTVWKPWAVAGSGVVLGLVGVISYQKAGSFQKKYEDAIVAECSQKPCTEPLPGPAQNDHDFMDLYDNLAVSLWVVGGTAAAAGLVGAFLNRPNAVRVEESQEPTSPLDVRNLSVAPTMIEGRAGLTTSYSFAF